MIKRTFKYTDFNGIDREEEIYFHLTRTELVELAMKYPGGIASWIRKITTASNGSAIYETLENILLTAYGEKSDDGRRFIKSPELAQAFKQTPMYDELFQELAFDATKMAKFIEEITPEMPSEAEKSNAARGAIVDFQPGPLPGQTLITETPAT